jgi:Glycosyl hydrolases family 16
MRRKSSAADGVRPESTTELIARISAESEASTEEAGRHRLPTVVVSHSAAPATPTGRALARRLAPVAVGAVVMLVAATIAALVQPVEQPAQADPDLNSAFAPDNPAPIALSPASPTAGGTPSSTPTTTAAAKPKPTTASKPAAAKPVPARKVATSTGDGTQAATAKGWTRAGGDEFTSGLNPTWGVYEGSSEHGNRSADQISVANGILTIRGDSRGNTGGMAWNDNQRFGKWEVRARFPKGDEQYHPVLILWPEGEWPQGGEVDFAETTSAADDVNFFLHYSSSNQQVSANKKLDLTQWHNYAVEWVDGRITGYIDGQKWFESTDSKTMPPGRMHATIQLDYFSEGGSPQATEMQVDYMRIYR